MPPVTFPIPTKGTYITFKSGGGTHEAHVSVRSVASVALSTEPAKIGGHDLHVMRLLGVGGGPVLSLLVAWAEGEGPGSYVRCSSGFRCNWGDGGCLFEPMAVFSGSRCRVHACRRPCSWNEPEPVKRRTVAMRLWRWRALEEFVGRRSCSKADDHCCLNFLGGPTP